MKVHDSLLFQKEAPEMDINPDLFYFAFGVENFSTGFTRFIDETIYYPKVEYINKIKEGSSFIIAEKRPLDFERGQEYKFGEDYQHLLVEGELNNSYCIKDLNLTLAEIKQLLYKYYSNPKLAFTFIDSSQSNLMDFEKYRTIITELYKREDRPMPNFALLKNTYDYIDLRKDGMIDMVEWTNAFGGMKGKLDAIKPKSSQQKRQLNKLRKWETSNDVINIYKERYSEIASTSS